MFMKNHGIIWFEYFVKTEVVQNKIPDHYSPSTQFPVDTIKSNPTFVLLYMLFLTSNNNK